MTFQVVDDDGNPIDAHYEVEGASLVLHSRGGGPKEVRTLRILNTVLV
jgi:hypothetical protein